MSDIADTSREAYREIVDSGQEEELKRRVAATLAVEPRTMEQITDEFPEYSPQSIRPVGTRLLRMGILKRDGRDKNPSGMEAYVHHITPLGERYLDGEVDPDEQPKVSEQRDRVVALARQYIAGEIDRDILRLAIEKHDRVKSRMKPEWEP